MELYFLPVLLRILSTQQIAGLLRPRPFLRRHRGHFRYESVNILFLEVRNDTNKTRLLLCHLRFGREGHSMLQLPSQVLITSGIPFQLLPIRHTCWSASFWFKSGRRGWADRYSHEIYLTSIGRVAAVLIRIHNMCRRPSSGGSQSEIYSARGAASSITLRCSKIRHIGEVEQ